MRKYPKKKFGQNFLNDQNILNKITNIIDIKNKNILEIGPGQGALTRLLLEKANKVVAFEIDNYLFNELKEKFKNDDLILINQDFLNADLSIYENFNIIANIPYNISTDIIFKIFNNFKNFENVVLLVQKEFGKRLCAKVGDSDYSKLSPSTKLFYNATYCFDVEASCFWPKPKVTSCVVHLKRTNEKYDVDYNELLSFIKTCFSMRRKTLWNNIKNANNISIEKYINICNDIKMDIKSRPEEWSLDQLLYLFKTINS